MAVIFAFLRTLCLFLVPGADVSIGSVDVSVGSVDVPGASASDVPVGSADITGASASDVPVGSTDVWYGPPLRFSSVS